MNLICSKKFGKIHLTQRLHSNYTYTKEIPSASIRISGCNVYKGGDDILETTLVEKELCLEDICKVSVIQKNLLGNEAG